MTRTRLTTADRLGIAWILAGQGADGDAVLGFIASLSEGLRRGEADAVDLHRELRAKYLEEGDETLGALIHLLETGERLAAAEQLLERHMALLKILLADPQTEFAARMVLMKIVRETEALRTA